MTNREKILAIDLVDLMYDYEIFLNKWCGEYCDGNCKKCLTNWLNEDAEGEIKMEENKEIVDDKEVKEVERHARNGDWIKIVDYDDDRYRDGDIFKVIQSDMNYGVDVKLNYHGDTAYIRDDEYIVLENYTPPKKKNKKKKSKWKTGVPTKEGYYYVTIKRDGKRTVDVYNLCDFGNPDEEVLAWMKLPKKYKEKGLV